MAKILISTVLAPLFILAVVCGEDASALEGCDKIVTVGGKANQGKILLCQLHESATLLAQLGGLVSDGLEGIMAKEGIAPMSFDDEKSTMEKRKHEYLRFGKRKDEYLRFGKRKHEYLRFGKRKHEYLRFG